MSVDLVPEWTIGGLCLTSYPYGVDADSTVDIGEPDMVVETVTSMLADGDLQRHVRDGNRTYVIPFYAMGATLAELADAEAALRSELRRTGLTLTHDPGDVFTPASVYEVQTAQLTPQRDDAHESHLIRKFTLTLTCGPFARSLNPTTVQALASGTTTVVVDTCDSATGWTGTRNGSPSPGDGPSVIWEAGSVGIMELSDTVGFPPETWTLTRTGAINFSTTPYLEVELTTLSAKGGATLSVSGHINDGPALPILQVRRVSDGSSYFRVTFDTRGVTASSITFKHTSSGGYGHAWQGLQVRNVARTDVAPNVTSRQAGRIVEVGGTERTPASIHVEPPSGSLPLGLTIVHTSPEMGAGYSPPLRRWRVSGNTELPQSTGFSAKYEAIHPNAFVAEVPISAVPEGGYEVVAALATDVAGTHVVHWSVKTVLPDGTIVDQPSVSVPCTFLYNNIWQLFSLGVVTLPAVRTAGAGKVQIGILRDPSVSPTVIIDDAWAFRAGDDCALTIVDANQPHLWIDSPSADTPSPRVSMGASADRSDSFHPGGRVMAHGTHTFPPGRTALFVATRGMDNARASMSYFKRWHSNAAEES